MRNDFFKLAPVGCFVLDTWGHILDVNPAGAAQMGYDPEALRGRSFGLLAAEQDRPQWVEYLHRVVSASGPERIELILERKNQEPFHARLESTCGPAEGGGGPKIYTVLLDTTTDQAVRSSLEISETPLYRAVLEAPLPVAIYAEDGTIIALSRDWTERTGYSIEDLPTMDVWLRQIYPGKDYAARRNAFYVSVWRLFERQSRRHDGEQEIRTRDGSKRIWDFYSAPLGPLPDGRRAVILVAIDVTEQKQTEAELVRARDRAEEMARLKSTFLANMSHEIRTPLTGIIGFAAVLAKELPDEHQEFAMLIESSGRRLLDMLNSVLDLAKLEANQVDIRLARLDLEEECRETVRLLQPLAQQKNLSLSFEAAPGAEHAAAFLDRPALARVLHNLVGNAIKFTDQGSVTIRLEADEKHVYLHVRDTGIGIDPAFFPYLFDEFRQESSGINRSHGGSGLGLTITKRLVELMRGRIKVQSAKGHGTVFTISFKRAPEAATETQAAATTPAVSPADVPERLRLLLVEDQLDTQYLLLELLDDLYEVTVASTAEEALYLAEHTQFEFILMDIQLGEGPDGTDILRQLRTMPAYRDVPIVALTAYALPGDRERFLEMGFTAYLSKPFDIEELLRLPVQLLAQRA